ncbi:AzlD domain-containing protein [Streptomyces sp. NPDC048172]|uniref:AzlD domain-containing protein n=1 Tax=Streptomyces sp. NPDC048172 TaxID=3365505 RepID=UPI0037223590
MNNPTLLMGAALLLAAGTFAFRFAGPALRARVTVSPRAERVLEVAALVLLTALVATTALYEGADAAGIARPAGVLTAAILAWRRAPFTAVVLTAAAVTAALRLAGVP